MYLEALEGCEALGEEACGTCIYMRCIYTKGAKHLARRPEVYVNICGVCTYICIYTEAYVYI
jgi:hypothetical protein